MSNTSNNNNTTKKAPDCSRLFLAVASKLLEKAHEFVNKHQTVVNEIATIEKIEKRRKKEFPHLIPYNEQDGIFLTKGNQSNGRGEHGIMVAIKQNCLAELLLPYRIFIKRGSIVVGSERPAGKLYTNVTKQKYVGFPIASELFSFLNITLDTTSIDSTKWTASVNIIQSAESIQHLAEALALAIPYADHVFSVLTYLWGHRAILESFILQNMNMSNRDIIESHGNVLNGAKSQRSNCTTCGIKCHLLAYQFFTDGVEQYHCIHCGMPSVSPPPKKRSKTIDPTPPGQVARLICLNTNPEWISWWKDKLDIMHKVDIIGTGEKGEENCLKLLDQRQEATQFFETYKDDLPSIAMIKTKGDMRMGVITELNKYYNGKKFKVDEYGLFGLSRVHGGNPADEMDGIYQKKEIPSRQVYTIAQHLRKNITKNVGEIEELKYSPGLASREAILIDCSDDPKIPRGFSIAHADPGGAMNLACNISHSERPNIDNKCEAHWLIINPRFIQKALKWKDSKGNGLESGMISPKMMHACVTYLNRKSAPDTAAWVVVQRHGTIVNIPIGYAHTVTNVGQCFKVAMDYIPTGHFYQCIISHLCVARKLKKKLTGDYLAITTHVFEKVHEEFHEELSTKKMPAFGK